MIYLTGGDWFLVVWFIALVVCGYALIYLTLSLRRNTKVCDFRLDIISRIYADHNNQSFSDCKAAYEQGATYDYMLARWWKPLTAKSFYSKYDCIIELYDDLN